MILFEILESLTFLPPYGLLTSPVEWICTMGGRVIYNLHACSTFTKVGGPGVQLHDRGQGNSYMVSR